MIRMPLCLLQCPLSSIFEENSSSYSDNSHKWLSPKIQLQWEDFYMAALSSHLLSSHFPALAGITSFFLAKQLFLETFKTGSCRRAHNSFYWPACHSNPTTNPHKAFSCHLVHGERQSVLLQCDKFRIDYWTLVFFKVSLSFSHTNF